MVFIPNCTSTNGTPEVAYVRTLDRRWQARTNVIPYERKNVDCNFRYLWQVRVRETIQHAPMDKKDGPGAREITYLYALSFVRSRSSVRMKRAKIRTFAPNAGLWRRFRPA